MGRWEGAHFKMQGAFPYVAIQLDSLDSFFFFLLRWILPYDYELSILLPQLPKCRNEPVTCILEADSMTLCEHIVYLEGHSAYCLRQGFSLGPGIHQEG